MKSQGHPITLLYLVPALSLLLGCFNPFSNRPENLDINEDFKEVTWKNEYAIKVPKYTSADRTLNDEADISFSNLGKEVYIMVISEPKEYLDSVLVASDLHKEGESITESALYVHMARLQTNYEVKEVVDAKPITVQGLEAHTAEAISEFEGTPIAYHFTVVAGPINVYTIWLWTLEEYRDRYRDTFEKVAKSFRLLQ